MIEAAQNCALVAANGSLDRVLAECYAPTFFWQVVYFRRELIELVRVRRKCHSAGPRRNLVASLGLGRRHGGVAERYLTEAD